MTKAPAQTSDQIRQALSSLVDTSYLTRLFRRSELTIMLWRVNHGLPYVRIPGAGRDTIRYILDEVTTWANQTGRQVYLPTVRRRLAKT